MKKPLNVAAQAGKSNTLQSAFKSASLIDLLRSPGRYTTNAPSDAAFNRLSSGSLDALFKNARTLKPFMSIQVLSGAAAANDIVAS